MVKALPIDLPDPPIGAHIDVRTFDYMPLNVLRILNSDILVDSTGDEFKAAVVLWCRAWHQIPAGSLPDDEAKLAYMSGFGRDLRGWKKVRSGALRGFFLCSDGRLYHPVICEAAVTSYSKKSAAKQSAEARWKNTNSLKTKERQNADAYAEVHADRYAERDDLAYAETHAKKMRSQCSEQNRTEQNKESPTTPTESDTANVDHKPVVVEEKSKADETQTSAPVDGPKPAQASDAGNVQSDAKRLADSIWAAFGKEKELERYRVSGACNDITMVGRWLKQGFTPDEIKAALDHLSLRAFDIQSPLKYVSQALPTMMERKRTTGSYEEARPGRERAPASSPADFDPNEFERNRRATMRLMAETVLERFVRGKNAWPANAGPPPGKPGSLITPEEFEDMKITCGVSNGG